jgi:hypothetical protein
VPEPAAPVHYHASSVDETNAMFDWSYCPLTVQPRGAVDAFSFDLTVVQLGPWTIGDLAYGMDVSTGLGYLDAYQLNLPLAGHVQARQHGAQAAVGPGSATLFRPYGAVDQPLISGGCHQIATKIDASALEVTLAGLLGHPIKGPLRILLGNDFTTGPGRSLVRMLQFLHSELANPDGLIHQPLVASRLWSFVLTGVLLATDHQYRAELAGTAAPSRPRHVKLAIDYIEADPLMGGSGHLSLASAPLTHSDGWSVSEVLSPARRRRLTLRAAAPRRCARIRCRTGGTGMYRNRWAGGIPSGYDATTERRPRHRTAHPGAPPSSRLEYPIRR